MPTLTPELVGQATHRAKRLNFDPGAMILTEGAHADSFYIVTKGMVEVILPRPGQSDVVVLQLGPGKLFGEMGFFHDRRRKASVRASERAPVEVLVMGYDDLDQLLSQSETTREALHELAKKREADGQAVLRGA
jgi:CRP-like cAMP-binding protein